ncbi:4Fe-4S binding protein [Trichloromonas sp.]|uniref:4Fe-4S binding protein n=1 Tax=Trichloromonas sp. TaxID=3069249 RepID=UPI003D81A719
MGRTGLKKALTTRHLVQGVFLLICLAIGVQFALFVEHFESGGLTPAYIRPVGVEAFLPVGALASLKYWALTGKVDPVHPAALVLLLTFLGISLVARRAFCSWICPVGTLSELCGGLGRRLFGRTFRIWRWLDVVLRLGKYALLLFFVKLILVDMPVMAIEGLLSSPYWAISDVKMLHFFTGMSPAAAGVITTLAVLSVVFQHFWCRYLCPYGALTGMVALLSPPKIRRDAGLCSGCGACGRNCPARLPVNTCSAVGSPECTGCLTCVESCPEPGALNMALPWWRVPVSKRSLGLVVVGLMLLGVGAGMFSGHWQSSLSYQDYQRIIPMAASMK